MTKPKKKKIRIGVVDYGMGNLGSIANMFKKLGYPIPICSDSHSIANAKGIIIPGVGSFDRGVENLKSRGLWNLLIDRVIEHKTPVLGICLGAQLLMTESEEGNLQGFGWVPGKVERFSFRDLEIVPKIPHMGWNELKQSQTSPLWNKMPNPARFYFVHSYFMSPKNNDHILGTTYYGNPFASAIGQSNIYGVQFHPEKSHLFGLRLLKNFMDIVCEPKSC
jgi:glutamine amidotransferase